MIKYRKNCKTCQWSKKNPEYRKRIYDATYNREYTGDSYNAIARDFPERGSVASLSNHAKKHISESAKIAPAIIINKVETTRAKLQQEMERAVDHETVLPSQDFEYSWDTVISQGMKELQDGRTKVSVSQLLAATKLKSDYFMKKRGQDKEIIKTMMRAGSGIKQQNTGTDGLPSQSS
jgi:hypothetical protein